MRNDVALRNKSFTNRQKVSEALTGRKMPDSVKEKIRQHNLGKKHSEETKRKISEINKKMGRKPPSPKGKIRSKEHQEKLTASKRGKPSSYKGEKHWNWKGGIYPTNLAIRKSLEYRIWRRAVFERDSYTCIFCGDSRGGNLVADHIKPFALFPELRFAIDNGRTLCKDCDKILGWKGSHVIRK